MEEWKIIEGSQGRYAVSTFGRVNSLAYGLMKGINDGRGYVRVWIIAHGRRRRFWFVHQLVAKAFLGEPPPGIQINHIDSNRMNNRLDNLEYITPKQNQAHSWKTNNRKPPHQGERTHFAKLTEADVLKIRQLRAEGHTYRGIAHHFNTKPANIWHICVGRTWKHLLPTVS